MVLLLIRCRLILCPFQRTLLGMLLLLASYLLALTIQAALPDTAHWSVASVVLVLEPQTLLAGVSEAAAFSAGNEIAYT